MFIPALLLSLTWFSIDTNSNIDLNNDKLVRNTTYNY